MCLVSINKFIFVSYSKTAPLPTVQETRLVLKPIMSSAATKDEPYVPCMRGKHALGELVLVQKPQPVEPKEKMPTVGVTPQRVLKAAPKGTAAAPSAVPPRRSSTGYRNFRKRRRRGMNRRWVNSRGRRWKAVAASPSVVHSPSLTVAMQPELDDVEGLLFVSFTTKVKHWDHCSAHVSVAPPRLDVLTFTWLSLLLKWYLICHRKPLSFTSGTTQPKPRHRYQLQYSRRKQVKETRPTGGVSLILICNGCLWRFSGSDPGDWRGEDGAPGGEPAAGPQGAQTPTGHPPCPAGGWVHTGRTSACPNSLYQIINVDVLTS